MNARHAIGATYSPPVGPSDCAVCGKSPFASGRPTSEVLGPLFTDYDLLTDAALPMACAGCAAMLGGKPGSVPMPLRMGHFVVVDGVMHRPSGAELAAIVYDPPPGLNVVAWTATRKRHASLRCGPCTPDLLLVGTESGTVAWDVATGRALLDAVSMLRAAARQDHILTGQYPPAVILALGSSWAPAESLVATYRPSLTLDLAVALARRPETTPDQEPSMPISESYRRAAGLVLSIGNAARERDRDPIQFWSTLYPRRLAAAAQRGTLLAMVGKLAEMIRVNPTGMADAVAVVETMSDIDAAETLRLCRETPLLVIAFARQLARESKES